MSEIKLKNKTVSIIKTFLGYVLRTFKQMKKNNIY